MSMKTISTDAFIEKAKKVHGDTYDYSKVDYTGYRNKVIIICKIHGEFEQRPFYHIDGMGCSKCGSIRRNRKNTTTTDDYIKACNLKHGDRYDYSKVEYTRHTDKIVIICPIHGEFVQIANNHRHGQGCPQCGIDSRVKTQLLSKNEFIHRSKKIHNDQYDYSKIAYIHGKSYVDIICPDHGIFKQMPYSHLAGKGCPSCSHRRSRLEDELSDYVNGFVDIEKHSKLISPSELDIYIPSRRIAIEFNGLFWHSELNGKDKKYHLIKTEKCIEKDIRLIHIFEDEWIFKRDIVKARLRNILGFTRYRVYARKCEAREISHIVKSRFINKYHIQGNEASSIRLGLFYKNHLVAVMTFGKNRFDKKGGYELIRYCTISSFNIIGGAGKLLKYFERNWKPSRIKTYADLRWSDGDLYEHLGFKHLRNSSPNYFYIIDGERKNRIQYQKHKLKDKLEKFNPSLSEWENMKMNGYDRIWDCGNMVFEKIYKTKI